MSATAIATYLSPAVASGGLAYYAWIKGASPSTAGALGLLSAAMFALAVFTLPGCMTVYAVEGDASILRDPIRAFRRAWSKRTVYLRAWAIALVSVSLSFLGLLAAVVGFLYTSVWAWEVVGYAFTVAMYAPAEERR